MIHPTQIPEALLLTWINFSAYVLQPDLKCSYLQPFATDMD